jgi:hypothetical protein
LGQGWRKGGCRPGCARDRPGLDHQRLNHTGFEHIDRFSREHVKTECPVPGFMRSRLFAAKPSLLHSVMSPAGTSFMQLYLISHTHGKDIY